MSGEDTEKRIRDAIGDQGIEGEIQLARVLRLLAAGEALDAAALGMGGDHHPGPCENDDSI